MDVIQGLGEAFGNLLDGQFQSAFGLYAPDWRTLRCPTPQIGINVHYSRET